MAEKWENLGTLLGALEDGAPDALGEIDDRGLLDELGDVQSLIKQSSFPDLNSVRMTGPAKKPKTGGPQGAEPMRTGPAIRDPMGPGIFKTGPAIRKKVTCPKCGNEFTA